MNSQAAFPRSGDQGGVPQYGMTLRDFFAGQALAGLHANAAFDLLPTGSGLDGDAERFAKLAYEFADAMIKHREAGE